MGTLRIILALSVLLAHSKIGGESWRPLIGGELAVEFFFMISGFLISLVLSEKYTTEKDSSAIKHFYIARAKRIFPSYWLVLYIILVYHAVTNVPFWFLVWEHGAFMGLYLIASNFFIFGLDSLIFVFNNGKNLEFPIKSLAALAGAQPLHGIANAPAWTLSLELMFYLMAPWFNKRSTTELLAFIACSISLRFLFYHHGYNTDPWTYRFFPFEISFFLLGMVAQKIYQKGWLFSKVWIAPIIISIAIFPLFSITKIGGFWLEGSILLAFGWLSLPSLFHTTKNIRWDRKIGNYSYELYLVHVPLLFMTAPFLTWVTNDIAHTIILILLSIMAAGAAESSSSRLLNLSLRLNKYLKKPYRTRI